MSEAVREGDAAGYMRHVWAGSGEFFREQQSWAMDLKAHRPDRFSLSLVDEAIDVNDGVAAVRVKMEWSLPDTVPHSLEFEAEFIEMPESLGGPWAYMGERFVRVPSSKATILMLDGDRRAAFGMARSMSQVTSHVERGLRRSVDRMTQVKVYPTLEHMRASIALSCDTDETMHWRPGESIKMVALPGDATAEQVAAELTRAYCRVALHEFGPGVENVPFWVRAGLIELAAERYENDAEMVTERVREWATRGQLVSWDRLAEDDGTAEMRLHAREQGHHMLGYIYDRHGRSARNAWFDAMASGRTLDEATREVFEQPFNDFARQWFEDLLTIREGSGGPS